MNLFQLVLKQMRQRALSTWLTLLSVMLGVALAIAIFLIRRESAKLFGQTEYGYDVLVGAKGSPLQLVLNTVYHIDRSPGNIPFSLYKDLSAGGRFWTLARIAVPIAVGDNYKGYRIVGTSPQLFGYNDEGAERIPADRTLEYRPGKRFEIAQGRIFAGRKFEAVVGSEIPRLTGLKIGDAFKASHGPTVMSTPDEHEEQWTVVGVLAPTNTANDKVLFIPLTSFYAIGGHGGAIKAQAALRSGGTIDEATRAGNASTTQASDDDHHEGVYSVDEAGQITIHLPEDQLLLSGVMVRSRRGPFGMQLMYAINNGNAAAAVNPASVMREFFSTFLDPSTKAWGAVAVLVSVVAIVAILVSIYNSIAGRIREIAILRALGATRVRILTLICLEAGLIGVIGGALGLLAGHALAAAASAYLEKTIGEGLRWWVVDRTELLYLAAVVVTCVLAGLVPALKAYRTPVAANLVAG